MFSSVTHHQIVMQSGCGISNPHQKQTFPVVLKSCIIRFLPFQNFNRNTLAYYCISLQLPWSTCCQTSFQRLISHVYIFFAEPPYPAIYTFPNCLFFFSLAFKHSLCLEQNSLLSYMLLYILPSICPFFSFFWNHDEFFPLACINFQIACNNQITAYINNYNACKFSCCVWSELDNSSNIDLWIKIFIF